MNYPHKIWATKLIILRSQSYALVIIIVSYLLKNIKRNKTSEQNIEISIFLSYFFIVLVLFKNIHIFICNTSRAFEWYAALYVLKRNINSYEQFCFYLRLNYSAYTFSRSTNAQQINHREAVIFLESNLTNVRMGGGVRIDRFWWNLKLWPFFVSSFIYIWIARMEK